MRKNAISTLISLSGCLRFNELAGSLAVTALSLLDNVDLQDDALTLLVMLVHHMGFSFIEHGFHDISVPAMAKNKMQSSDYTRLVLAAANQSSLQVSRCISFNMQLYFWTRHQKRSQHAAGGLCLIGLRCKSVSHIKYFAESCFLLLLIIHDTRTSWSTFGKSILLILIGLNG